MQQEFGAVRPCQPWDPARFIATAPTLWLFQACPCVNLLRGCSPLVRGCIEGELRNALPHRCVQLELACRIGRALCASTCTFYSPAVLLTLLVARLHCKCSEEYCDPSQGENYVACKINLAATKELQSSSSTACCTLYHIRVVSFGASLSCRPMSLYSGVRSPALASCSGQTHSHRCPIARNTRYQHALRRWATTARSRFTGPQFSWLHALRLFTSLQYTALMMSLWWLPSVQSHRLCQKVQEGSAPGLCGQQQRLL